MIYLGWQRHHHHWQSVQEGMETWESAKYFPTQWKYRIQVELSQRVTGMMWNIILILSSNNKYFFEGDQQRLLDHVWRCVWLWSLAQKVVCLGGQHAVLLDLPWEWEGSRWELSSLHYDNITHCFSCLDPIGSIDLGSCVTQEVAIAPREICSRMNTFMLETSRAANKEDKESLVVKRQGNNRFGQL